MIMFGHDSRIICTCVGTNIILNTIVTTCDVSMQYKEKFQQLKIL